MAGAALEEGRLRHRLRAEQLEQARLQPLLPPGPPLSQPLSKERNQRKKLSYLELSFGRRAAVFTSPPGDAYSTTRCPSLWHSLLPSSFSSLGLLRSPFAFPLSLCVCLYWGEYVCACMCSYKFSLAGGRRSHLQDHSHSGRGQGRPRSRRQARAHLGGLGGHLDAVLEEGGRKLRGRV